MFVISKRHKYAPSEWPLVDSFLSLLQGIHLSVDGGFFAAKVQLEIWVVSNIFRFLKGIFSGFFWFLWGFFWNFRNLPESGLFRFAPHSHSKCAENPYLLRRMQQAKNASASVEGQFTMAETSRIWTKTLLRAMLAIGYEGVGGGSHQVNQM